jgi:O-antigen/teichoic acid export membrane protein
MVLIPPLVIVLVFARPAINIFLDESFVAAYSVFILLVIFTFIRGMTTPFANLINGIDRPDISAKFGITVCITNVILNYLIIPKNGILSNIQITGYNFGINGAAGAAFSTIISFLIPFFGLRIVSKRLTGIKLLQTHTPRHIVAGFIMGGVLYLIAYSTTIFPVIRWFILLGFCFLGLGIYIVILFILREFSKKDLDFFLKIINLKEMVNYIKSELKGGTKK